MATFLASFRYIRSFLVVLHNKDFSGNSAASITITAKIVNLHLHTKLDLQSVIVSFQRDSDHLQPCHAIGYGMHSIFEKFCAVKGNYLYIKAPVCQ